ncbi:MAG: hypothetical protein HKO92_03980 [Flavobacteriaceae bacterium]|nr:hypothetical protein [Flavobacteriaceae bacterium]
MKSFRIIQKKLEQFSKRYYTNELIKGALLFFTIGLLYFLFTLFVEHMLWLEPLGRTILFWLFVLVELVLFVKLIAIPLAKLFNLKKGITLESASKIIGQHFPEVNDKLLNVLQLKHSGDQSELLLASIEQKSLELKPIPFQLAISFKKNTKYLKYAAIPIVIVLLSFLSGKINWFSDSYKRVVNYQTAYEPPAPFQFFVVNDDNLQALENQTFSLRVITEGEVAPQDVQIQYSQQNYFLKKLPSGEFEYEFTQPKSDINFRLSANNVTSKTYTLNVLETPSLLGFDMVLDYPNYTNKKDETLKNSGNAIVPLGTKVTWKLKTKATETVTLTLSDTILQFFKDANDFALTKQLYKTLEYSINTSNELLKDYESLGFNIDVVKDDYPELNVKMKQDSLDLETMYFYGQASDDYGLRALNLVYYPTVNPDQEQRLKIPVLNSNFTEFASIFPDLLNLKEGKRYDIYFEVFDNDAINNYKKTKSEIFSFRKQTQNEKEQQQLEEQSETIDNLEDSLEKMNKQEKDLQELSKTQKEKSELNFNEKKKLENFLKRQKQQEEMMQDFNKKLKDNLEEIDNKEEDRFKEELKQRVEENQEQLKKDEELLKELEKLADKINKEELAKKLEDLAKQNKNKKRSLQQLLELTKRFYVSQKMDKIKQDLSNLAEEQEKLSEESEQNNTKEEQEKLNKKFEDLQKELEDLRKENKELRKPMDVPNDKKAEEQIKKDQQEASENLEKKEQSQDQQEQQNSSSKAKQKQKKAAQKMKQMSEKMSQIMMSGGGAQLSEDIDMLRQILDNLVLFSFNQEDLMEKFNSIEINHKEYAKSLIKQQGLREHFEHVDDSLFALSLRNPQISEKINTQITEAFFNIDKSLNEFSENRIYQGVSAQQYTITSANTLASFLSDVLDNMQMQMNPSPGQGQGDMQLPDIIMSQEELSKMMEEGLDKKEGEEKGKKEGDKEGEDNKKGEGKNQKEGNSENNQEGEGAPNSEELNGELMEIYKRQQQLRNELRNKIGKEGLKGNASELVKKMEEIELDLINKGFTHETLKKMMDLQHQLLKLENATFQQGEDNKRVSKTNTKEFTNTSNTSIIDAKKYFNTTEILNRKALPLKQEYKRKVQEYFKQKND